MTSQGPARSRKSGRPPVFLELLSVQTSDYPSPEGEFYRPKHGQSGAHDRFITPANCQFLLLLKPCLLAMSQH